MKEITVIEPQFSTKFQCIGSACREHCCSGWRIALDKPTVNKYLKSKVIDIRLIANNSIDLIKKNHANWGIVKFNEAGNCAFMDENRLCGIHAKLGANALSVTCATYPRATTSYKTSTLKSLTLSCPEATRLLLDSPDAMLLDEQKLLQSGFNKSPHEKNVNKLLNLMSMHLINASGTQVNHGLYAIALLLLFAKKQGSEVLNNSQEIESYFSTLVQDIESGEIKHNLDSIASNNQLQWSLLLRLQAYIDAKPNTRGLRRFRHFVKRLLYIQVQNIDNSQVSENIVRLDNVWNEKVQPWLEEHPHVMRNYLLYRLYNDQFPQDSVRTPLSWLYLITAEWYLIKALIAATAELTGEINKDDVINIIYSFHAVTKHNSAATQAFFDEIDKVKVNDDISLIYLLK